jgi:hypothetical protein
MVKAATLALVELLPTRRDKQASLLPPLNDVRAISQRVARAVGLQAIKDGLAEVDEAGLMKELAANFWEPGYEPYEFDRADLTPLEVRKPGGKVDRRLRPMSSGRRQNPTLGTL